MVLRFFNISFAHQKILKHTCLVLLLVCTVQQASASHLMGSDITYRCLGNNTYKITLKVYRDCAGTILPSKQILRTYCDNSTNQGPPISLTRIKISDITGINETCVQGGKSRCAVSDAPYGVEEHIYEGTFDASVFVFCDEITISWKQAARNKAITTGASEKNFYTEAIIYPNLADCNSSPEFTTPPTAFICAGKDFVFNNGAIDVVDNDILTYKFIEPLENKDYPIPYIAPFSSLKPLTFYGFPNTNLPLPQGFHLDPSTGNLNFRPMVANEVSVMVLEVTEWRKINDTLRVVGKTRRDMQINVLSCNGNEPPVVYAESDTICAGDYICLPISCDDLDAGNRVSLNWNKAITGASFKILSSSNPLRDSAVLCWQTQPGHAREAPYYFTVSATDNACPLVGKSVKAISIYVRPVNPPSLLVNKTAQCLKEQNFDFTNTTPNKNKHSFLWELSDGRILEGVDLEDITFDNIGKHWVKATYTDSNGCINSVKQEVTVNGYPNPDISATGFKAEYCLYNKQVSYSLGPLPANGMFKGNNVKNNTYTPTKAGYDTITYARTEKGCYADTAVVVRVNPAPLANFSINKREQCFDAHQFNFTNITVIQTGTFTSNWDFSNGKYLRGVEDAKQIRFSKPDTFGVKLTAISMMGCKDSTETTVIVHPEPNPNFSGIKEYFCRADPRIQLIPEQTGGVFTGSNIEGYTYIPNTEGKDTVTYSITVNGCFATRTDTFTVLPKPVLNVIEKIPCLKDPIELNVEFPGSTYLWSDGSTLPTFTVTEAGRYSVTLFNICDTIQKNILVGDCYYGVMPNTFTPNNDGLNDVFLPYNVNAENMHFEVFSRWGELLFESDNLAQGWDGTFKNRSMPEGVYMWLLKVEYYDENLQLHRKIDKGNVTLIR